MTAALNGVVFVSEAADIFGVSKKTIEYHIMRGNLTYKQNGQRGAIVIDLASLDHLHQRIYNRPLSLPKTRHIPIQKSIR